VLARSCKGKESLDYDSYLCKRVKLAYSFEAGARLSESKYMPANHSSCLNLALVILFGFVSIIAAQAQSSDEQSLGDVARTKRLKKPTAKVIDED